MSIYVMTQSTSLAFNQYVNPVALAAIRKSVHQYMADLQNGNTTLCTLESKRFS